MPAKSSLRSLGLFLLTLTLLLGLQAPFAEAGDGSLNSQGEMKIQINLRYAPTAQQLNDFETALKRMSFDLCDATEGQVKMKEIRFTAGAAEEDRGNYWYYPQVFRTTLSYWSSGASLGVLGSHVNMSSSAQLRADVLLHELGHHAFGLGEQYDEQSRFDGPCGIGPGFQMGAIDERNHSIMQQSGDVVCVGGSNNGNRCLEDADCPSGTCQTVLMSEMSVASNHDPLLGNFGCPAKNSTTKVKVDGELLDGATQIFDSTTWITAANTSSLMEEVNIVDSSRVWPSFKLRLYFADTGTRKYTVYAVVDAGALGGTAGSPRLLDYWHLTFRTDGILDTQSPSPSQIQMVNPATGGDLDIDLDFGTPGLAGGLSMVNSGISTATATATGGEPPNCPWQACLNQKLWHTATERWETSEQTIHHGASDWETVVTNYPFLQAPSGLPLEAAPASCATAVPNFVRNVDGADQVLLVIDRSGSMAWSSKSDVEEVCNNGADDDGDGNVDETPCAQSRLHFAQAAARAFVDLQRGQGIQLGVVPFNHTNRVSRPLADLNAANAWLYKLYLSNVLPYGNTAIGSALDAAKKEFQRIQSQGKSRAVLLLSDGENNRGIDPQQAADALKALHARVYSIPAGANGDRKLLGQLSAKTGGAMVPALEIDELPAIYAELSARHRGEALILPRTRFAVAQYPEIYLAERPDVVEPITPEALFEIPVEPGADELVVFLSGRNRDMATWQPDFELVDPTGALYTLNSPEVMIDPDYLFVELPSPAPGLWMLRVMPVGFELQQSTVLAHLEHGEADFFVDAKPKTASVADPVMLFAHPSYAVGLEGALTVEGEVLRPDGTTVPITLSRDDERRPFSTGFSNWGGRGAYEVRLHGTVPAGTLAMMGESIFEGPKRFPVTVPPFERFAATSFYVVDAACETEDCDGDGVPNDEECDGDPDGDDIASAFDPDADGDEIPDGAEGLGDSDGDGIPDACDADLPVPDLVSIIDMEAEARELACSNAAQSAELIWRTVDDLDFLRWSLERRVAAGEQVDPLAFERLDEVVVLKRLAAERAEEGEQVCGEVQGLLTQALELEDELLELIGPT